MTITYTFQYRFFPKQCSAPKSPEVSDDVQEDLLLTLEYRRKIAPFLKNWLDVLNTWRLIIRYGIIPIFILLLAMSIIEWLTFLILTLMTGVLSFFIWARIRAYQRTVVMIEVVIDEVIAENVGYKPPKILEDL